MSTHIQDAPNHLINEASPYLQQHAYNPVDWFPWGQEALEKAKRENKPIFLSIGYSTCHWCHVMAHESFENDAIAAILNEHFISIKVDREERPDIDAVYMDFVQKTTGSGGWPMSVFLTPEGKPFYGGTYYPPTDMYGRPGFGSLLRSINNAWETNRDKIIESADQITRQIQEQAHKSDMLILKTDVLEQAYRILERIYDPNHGGFGGAPKFPQPSMLSFLLVYSNRTGNTKALDMVEKTLLAMSRGGIHDHLGGGFHRYSVDEQWLTPHFEKMLYDQALISRALIQAYQIRKKSAFKETAGGVFDYVLRDMTSPEGGFYSAEDADSEGKEGTFYVWTSEQIAQVLNKKEQSLFNAYYGVTKQGNFEHSSSILNITVSLEDVARQAGIDTDLARKAQNTAMQKLFAARARRPRPHRDEKIITGWNGLMISSLAYGGAVLNEARYIEAAQESADFLIAHLYKDNRLMRYYGKDKANGYAVLEDYAFFIQGLIDLYEADFDPRWLQVAVELTDQMIALFEDETAGGFYLTGSDVEKLIVRNRPDYDGATPSGNSVAAAVLIRLSEFTGNKRYLQKAHDTLAAFQSDVKSRPTSLTEMLIAANLWLGPRSEIVIAAATEPSNIDRMLELYRDRFLPRSVILLKGPKTDISFIEKLSETVKDKQPINGQTTVYLCEDFICQRPLTDPNEFLKLLSEHAK